MRASKALKDYQAKWLEKTVRYLNRDMVVVGVGDDGAQCEYDYRRRYKPNGTLILRDPDGAERRVHEFDLHNATPGVTEVRRSAEGIVETIPGEL